MNLVKLCVDAARARFAPLWLFYHLGFDTSLYSFQCEKIPRTRLSSARFPKEANYVCVFLNVRCTLGEICSALEESWGRHRPSTAVVRGAYSASYNEAEEVRFYLNR